MIPGLAVLVLAGAAFQDPAPRVFPRAITLKTWEISGAAEVADRTELGVRARRVERRWDSKRSKFSEFPSDEGTLRGRAVANGKRFDATLKPGTAGRYAVSVEVDQAALYSERAALGAVESLFARGGEDVKKILAQVDKATAFLDEIERIEAGEDEASNITQENFSKRVNEVELKLQELHRTCDLTATLRILREVMIHVRQVQLWDEKPEGDNDPPRDKDRPFMDENVGIAQLRKSLHGIPEVLSEEIKVSTALILERLVAQAGKDARRGDEARAAARAASRLAGAAPFRDVAFARLLEDASDSSADPANLQERLKAAAKAHLVP